MNIRKLLTIVFVVTTMFILAACGKEESTANKDNSTTVEQDGTTTNSGEGKSEAVSDLEKAFNYMSQADAVQLVFEENNVSKDASVLYVDSTFVDGNACFEVHYEDEGKEYVYYVDANSKEVTEAKAEEE